MDTTTATHIIEDGADKIEEEVFEFDTWKESRLLFGIAVPTSCVQLFNVLIFPLTASFVGRQFGSTALAGLSLASLIGNISCVSVIIGTLSGCETLLPRAMGGGVSEYHQVGRIAIRGFLVGLFVMMPIVYVLWNYMEFLLTNILHQDEAASKMVSGNWIHWYLLALLSVLLFRTVQRFLNCQHIVWPCVVSTVLISTIVHPILLSTLATESFVQTGKVICISQCLIATLTLLIMYFWKPHHSQTFSLSIFGSELNSFLLMKNKREVMEYIDYSFGGVLSLSEWWFFETACILAGRMGTTALVVHSIAYQITPLCWMIPQGLSMATSVRIGNTLGSPPVSLAVQNATRLANFSLFYAIAIGLFQATFLNSRQTFIVNLFLGNEDITNTNATHMIELQLIQEVWYKICIQVFFLNIFCIEAGILRALGYQWRLATVIVIILWSCTLPTIIYVCFFRDQFDMYQSFLRLWTIIPCGYFLMTAVLFYIIQTADWHEISTEIIEKQQQNKEATIKSKKLPSQRNDDKIVTVTTETTSLLLSIT